MISDPDSVVGIVHQLRKAKGRNKKKKVLEKYKRHELFRQFLQATLDESITYGVSAPSTFRHTGKEIDGGFFSGLLRLSSRETTGNQARELACALASSYGELACLVLGGSLKAGTSIATINEVMPGLIPTFEVMLGENAKIEKFPCLASIKYDGVRLLAKVENEQATLYTRSGKTVPIARIEESASDIANGWYDGELVYDEGLQKHRTKISGEVNKCLKGTQSDIPGCVFKVFDYITLKGWSTKDFNFPYSYRYSFLSKQIKNIPYIDLVEQHTCSSEKQVQDLYTTLSEKGYEGLMIRWPKDGYEWKRSTKLIKQKAQLECVLMCKEVLPGKGKYEGKIGALHCIGVIDGKEIRTSIGTGLSDFDRERIPEDFIGNYIDIEYNDIVKQKESITHSLFLPVFKRIIID